MAPNVDSPDTAEQSANSAKIARAAGAASIAVFTSRITGLAREIILTRKFGASMDYEAFLLGFRIPNLTRDLFAEGALSSAFVPVFVEYLTTKDKQEAARLANLVATGIIIIVGAICLLGIVGSPWLVEAFGGGFHQVPGKFEQAVLMTRIMSKNEKPAYQQSGHDARKRLKQRVRQQHGGHQQHREQDQIGSHQREGIRRIFAGYRA